jgi:ketosteroid isomerase-like protein
MLKSHIILMAVGITAAAATITGTAISSSLIDSQAEKEVQNLEQALAKAVVRGDRDFFERTLAQEFTHTSHTGAFKSRAEWMAESKFSGAREKTGATRYDEFELDDLAVRIYGDSAVVTGRSTPKGTTAKGEPITGQFRFLRVWVRRQGRWQAVAFEGTRIAPSPVP